MRFLFVLLACFAASEAAIFTYSNFIQSNSCVNPSSRIYRYNIFFRSSWCTTKYYAPILQVYPGSDCGKEGWKETSIADVKTEMENLLKESIFKIAKEMVAKREEWLKTLEETHKKYKDCYASCLDRYYSYKIARANAADKEKLLAEKKTKEDDYCAKLQAHREESLKKYSASLIQKLNQISSFHETLIQNAQKCLDTRLTKIHEYHKQLASKISSLALDYYKYLMANLKQSQECYKATLVKVHESDTFAKAQVDDAVAAFYTQELKNVRSKLVTYTEQLVAAQKKLVATYACSYRCYLSNSCLQFYKRSYYSACQKLSGWSSYTKSYVKRYSIAPFKGTWRKTTYTSLKTCDLSTVNKSADSIAAEVRAKIAKNVEDYTAQFTAWKAKWSKYFDSYLEKYKACVKDRHAWLIKRTINQYLCANNGRTLTAEQEAAVAKYKQELSDKFTVVVKEYAEKLAQSLADCTTKFNKSMDEYKKKAEEYLKTIIASFTSCLNNRATKIAEYKKKLVTSRDSQRASLLKTLIAEKVTHFKSYISLLKCYHGDEFPKEATDLLAAYASKLVANCNSVMDDFDNYWAEIIPKLVAHYSCGYKCTVQVCVPSYQFGSYYRWVIRYPTSSSYTFYYRSFCKSSYHRIRMV